MYQTKRISRKLENFVLSELKMNNCYSVQYFFIHNQCLITVKKPLEQSEYMFNLGSNLPTKKSINRTILSKDLVLQLKSGGKDFFQKYIIEDKILLDNETMQRLPNELENKLFEELELNDEEYKAYFNKYKYCDLLNIRKLDEKSQYIFNFKTGQPTKRSPIQSQISAELIEKLIENSSEYFSEE